MMGSENQQVPSPPSSEMMARQKQPSASVKQKVFVIHKQIGCEWMQPVCNDIKPKGYCLVLKWICFTLKKK